MLLRFGITSHALARVFFCFSLLLLYCLCFVCAMRLLCSVCVCVCMLLASCRPTRRGVSCMQCEYVCVCVLCTLYGSRACFVFCSVPGVRRCCMCAHRPPLPPGYYPRCTMCAPRARSGKRSTGGRGIRIEQNKFSSVRCDVYSVMMYRYIYTYILRMKYTYIYIFCRHLGCV